MTTILIYIFVALIAYMLLSFVWETLKECVEDTLHARRKETLRIYKRAYKIRNMRFANIRGDVICDYYNKLYYKER